MEDMYESGHTDQDGYMDYSEDEVEPVQPVFAALRNVSNSEVI